MSEVEIGGLIYPNEDKTKTKWLAPDILPNEKRDGEKTILLLDEITSCTKRVQVAAYQLILDRRIGEYTLPKGTFVIALGNREEDDGVYVSLAAPLADRFEIHYIDISYENWKTNYAIPYGVHPFIIRYLNAKPSALHTQQKADGEMLFATPRSWTRVSDILKVNSDLSDPIVAYKIVGNIGMSDGAAFIDYCKTINSTLSAEDYLSGLPAPQNPDEIARLIELLTEKVGFLRSVRSVYLLNEEQRDLTEQVIKSFFRFPSGEYTVLALRNILALNRSVVKTIFGELDDPRIIDFVRKSQKVSAG